MFEIKNRIPNPAEIMEAESYLLARGYSQEVINKAYSYVRNNSYLSHLVYRQGLTETLEEVLDGGVVK